MIFFDAHMLYGVPSQKRLYPFVPDCGALLQKMREFGIAKAVVRREEQFFGHPAAANQLLAADLLDQPTLYGVWTLLPPHCHELAEPADMRAVMKRQRIIGWQFFPAQNHYCFHWRVLKIWLELAQQHHIPLFIDLAFVQEQELYAVLDRYPELTVVLRNDSVFPPDRLIRPLLSEFPRTHFELSKYLTADGITDLVANGFTERLLYSSHFQESHVGGPMLMLKHATISEPQKALIAAGNLERLIGSIADV